MTQIELSDLHSESYIDIKKSGIYTISFKNKSEKYYVGSTKSTQGFAKRWRSHLSSLKRNIHHSTKLQRAFNKYKLENIIFKIIELIEDDDCINKEQFWIDHFDSFKNGYNSLAKSYFVPSKWKHKEEIKQFYRERMLGDKNPNFGKKLTEKQKLLRKQSRCIPILQLDNYGDIINEYCSMAEAGKAINSCSGTICRAIKNKNKVKGFYWIKKENVSENIQMSKLIIEQDFIKNPPKDKLGKVYQLDINFNLINTFESCREASLFINIDYSNMNRVLRGIHLQCKDYFFIKESNYNDLYINELKEKYIQKQEMMKLKLKINRQSNENKKIKQYDLNNNFIRDWDSIKEAGEILHLDGGGISRACRTKSQRCGQFIWKYDV